MPFAQTIDMHVARVSQALTGRDERVVFGVGVVEAHVTHGFVAHAFSAGISCGHNAVVGTIAARLVLQIYESARSRVLHYFLDLVLRQTPHLPMPVVGLDHHHPYRPHPQKVPDLQRMRGSRMFPVAQKPARPRVPAESLGSGNDPEIFGMGGHEELRGASVGQVIPGKFAPDVPGIFSADVVVVASVGTLDHDTLGLDGELSEFLLSVRGHRIPVGVAGINLHLHLRVDATVDFGRGIDADMGSRRLFHVRQRLRRSHEDRPG
mmetsp:Transcript_12274/g.26855  ORF Transcript_12274/g.26855 Transcript_12274/m.26855 type:complete len:264 (+) Transcript_12274:1054-1845(+)